MDHQGTPSNTNRSQSNTSGGYIPQMPNTSGGYIPQMPNTSGGYIPAMPSPTGGFSPPPYANMGFANYAPNPHPQGSFVHLLMQPTQQQAPMHHGAYMQTTQQQPAIQEPVIQESPLQFNTYRLQDETSSEDGVDVVPETQPKTKPAKSKKGKKPAKSNPAGKTPCTKWTVEEEVNLAKAWSETSENPCTAAFWKRLKASFDIRMRYVPHVRSVDAISSKVKMLLSSVSQFACIYNNTLSARKSGEGDADVLTKAQTRYRNTYTKNFTHAHAWEVVKDCPKFIAVDLMHPSDVHAPRPKRSKTSETDSPGSSDAHTQFNVANDDDTEASERPRPIGRNAARRAGSSSTAGASSDNVTALLEQLNAYNASHATYIETMVRNADVRYERQRSTNLQFYMQPHDHLTGAALELMLQEKERMRNKYG